jgi:dipeptidyl aminopeptidase/acylaminoacyl peptidase
VSEAPEGHHHHEDAHRHDDEAPVTVAPYGSWRSSIEIEDVAGTSIALAEPWLDGDDVYWLESRSAEGGRRTLLRRTPDGATHELTPNPFRVGNRVHEYGGGSYVVDRGRVIVSSAEDDRLWRVDADGAGEAVAITPRGQMRYADLRFDPARDLLYAVRETHDANEPARPDLVVNELVAVTLDRSDGPGRVLVTGPDFVGSPRPSPDGRRLAWLEWDLPDMPWDSTRLRVAEVAADGGLVGIRTVAGGPGISIVQPAWRADGVLHYVSDETGWWNLYALDGPDGVDGAARNLAPMEAELGDPAWVFGRSSYGFGAGGDVLAVARADGRDAFLRIHPDGRLTPVETPFTEVEGLQVGAGATVAIAAGPHDGAVLVRLDPATGLPAGVLARSLQAPIDPGVLPHAEPITFPTSGDDIARALYFPPTNDGFRAPDGELPPLLVLSHGGPTSAASSALSLDRAFFTSRGIAVVDVDYRGSSGYGRPYRDALAGQWGIADVDDCVAAAQFLVARGSVDPERLAIRGGSAGGYTTLAALTFRPEVFAAGISHYGIADLELIHIDGHKFESRYDEGLLAPWPEGRQVFHDRSPIHFFDRVRAPMLIFQGLDDRVVPPSQVDAMVGALHARGIPHAAMTFEGEGHGFRRAETRRATYAAELSFLGQVFGFTPADDVPHLRVEHLTPAG